MERYVIATAEMHVSVSFNDGVIVSLPPRRSIEAIVCVNPSHLIMTISFKEAIQSVNSGGFGFIAPQTQHRLAPKRTVDNIRYIILFSNVITGATIRMLVA